MGHNYKSGNRLGLPRQLVCLKDLYSNCIQSIKLANGRLTCIMVLKPSPESCEYKVRIESGPEEWPHVWLLSPQLEKVNGKLPHHLYTHKHPGKYPELCVFDCRKECNELRKDMLGGKTLVPWILSWLSAYEYWTITGEWHHAQTIGTVQLE